MLTFLFELRDRNGLLFWFGLLCLVAAGVCGLLLRFTHTEVLGVNAWLKPLKFSLATTFFVWAMAWYLGELPDFDARFYSWSMIGLLGFELVYIFFMAGRGEMSHFNVSTPLKNTLFSLMALAITLVVLYTAWVSVPFFTRSFPHLPVGYIWGIRLGIALFVVFAFEGFLMGGRLSHTIGGPDGGPGLAFLNWSTRFGDGRVAHFVGMHALQVLPLLGWFVFRGTTGILLVSALYALLAVFVLVQALGGRPLVADPSQAKTDKPELRPLNPNSGH